VTGSAGSVARTGRVTGLMIKRRRGDGEHPRTRAGGTPSAGETKSERDKVPRALRDGARKRFFLFIGRGIELSHHHLLNKDPALW